MAMRALRHQRLQRLEAVLDRLHVVVQEVDLAAALELAQHRFADRARAFIAHEGLDGEAALRRRRDHRQIAQALERHAQGARNRCGGERQHVDLGAHRLDHLLVPDAEAVLLVDHEEAEARELHIGRQQLVRADDDVDGAVFQPGQRGLGFLRRAEARQLGDLDGPLAEAIGDVLEMLLGEQRRRRQDGDLLAAGDGDEGGAQCHLRLAEADVAADEPVHRPRRDHVLDDGMDGGMLVGRFLEAEARGEGLVVVRLEAEREAFARGPPCIQRQQLGGGVAHLLGGAPARLFPLAGAEPVQCRLVGADAGVAGDEMQLRDRHRERRLVGVLEVQELARLRVAEGDEAQAEVSADAVVHVHDRVADVEFGEILDQRVDVACLLLALLAARARRGGEELGLGDVLDRRGRAGAAGPPVRRARRSPAPAARR